MENKIIKTDIKNRLMNKITIILVTVLSVFCSIAFGQSKCDLKIDFMLRGNIYARSSIADTFALGGFGKSSNSPKSMNGEQVFSESGLFLKIDTTEITTLSNKYNAYKLYLGNKTDTILVLNGSDSRLDVIAEVYHNRRWKAIEYLPNSGCGNSYHQMYLKQNEYWEFIVPKFSGKIKTKLRYRLRLADNRFVYSNEINTSIHKNQMVQNQKRKPQGIMDPYRD